MLNLILWQVPRGYTHQEITAQCQQSCFKKHQEGMKAEKAPIRSILLPVFILKPTVVRNEEEMRKNQENKKQFSTFRPFW